MILISNPFLPCNLTLVSERLVLVSQYNAYPTAIWDNLGWRKAGDGVIMVSSDYRLVLGRASSH